MLSCWRTDRLRKTANVEFLFRSYLIYLRQTVRSKTMDPAGYLPQMPGFFDAYRTTSLSAIGHYQQQVNVASLPRIVLYCSELMTMYVGRNFKII